MQKMSDKMHKEELLKNVDKIHTTEMGVGRIQKNLEISVLDNHIKKYKLKLEMIF